MSFQDDFASALQAAGFDVPPSSVPSQDTLESGLESVRVWIDSLEPDTRAAIDEVTADFQVKSSLADPEVNIAPGLLDLLQAFDSVPASTSISAVLEVCATAMQQLTT